MLTLCAGVYYINMFNNNHIQTTAYGILSSKVRDDFVVAQLSDLHEKSFGLHNHRLFHKVEALRPDIIAITGDLVAHEKQKTADTAYTYTLAKGLVKIAPCFFVTGNHEREFDAEITDALARGGVTVIRGEMHTLQVGNTDVNISGIDDVTYGMEGIAQTCGSFVGKDGFNIFLTHQPQVYELCLQNNIDLILAGHTHAGQIRIPKITEIYMSGQGWFPKYIQGEFTDGETTMIISRGLGASGYPTFRLNNPPELVAVYVSPLKN